MKIFSKELKKILLPIFLVIALIAVAVFYFSVAHKIGDTANADSKSLPTKLIEKKDVKILFVGDMMFDRYIRQVTDTRGNDFVFKNVESLLKSNDLVVGNLEGPITDNPSASINSVIGSRENYIFTFDPKFAKILKDENISLVNIGNNHISNFSDAGIASTRKYLADAGVSYFGDPADENGRIAIEAMNGWKIAFINYDQFVSNAEQKTLDDIKKVKSENVDFIFLYTHWGTEFKSEPNEKIKNLAHEFIDNGVDLIIGSHPHVIQSQEQYKGKMIYYSLGNFIFDQYFDAKTQEGLAVEVDIDAKNKSMGFRERRVKMKTSGQTILEQ